ncbi:MAG TPA: phage holin family protein [Myxococcaceae bacterium]|nr:phage holin family protein [Myxococcaceae bacterium]
MQTSEPSPDAARSSASQGGLGAQLNHIFDGLTRLILQHLDLARLELAAEARTLGNNLARVAAFLPLVMVGYIFLCGALAIWLGAWLTPAAGWAIVGGVNLVAGALGVWFAVRSLNGRPPPLSATRDELRASAEVLTPRVPTSGDLPHGR